VSDAAAYYLMDFSNDYSVLWNVNCTQTGIGNFLPGSCDGNPTFLSPAFNQTDNSEGIIRLDGTFTNAQFGGYVVSGHKYTAELCLATPDSVCKIVQIYSGESVSADNWAFNSNGAYGIIGAGPNSALWNGFVDASSLTATYSIELSRIQAFSHRLSQSV